MFQPVSVTSCNIAIHLQEVDASVFSVSSDQVVIDSN